MTKKEGRGKWNNVTPKLKNKKEDKDMLSGQVISSLVLSRNT